MMKEFLDYCKEADHRVIQVFQNTENIPQKSLALFSHVLTAQHIWASRMLGRKSLFPFSHVYFSHDFEKIHCQNFDLLALVLETIPFDEKINYTNSLGKTYTSKVDHILFHVVNHSTHHRGQIAMLFRAEGIEPPITDYIFLKQDLDL